MHIPEGWNCLQTELCEDTTTAFYHTDDFTIQITHRSSETTLFQVREGFVESYEWRDTDKVVDCGFHRSPVEAFRFAEAYIADGGDDFRRRSLTSVSPRYARAINVLYLPH